MTITAEFNHLLTQLSAHKSGLYSQEKYLLRANSKNCSATRSQSVSRGILLVQGRAREFFFEANREGKNVKPEPPFQ
jgi:hypothetical protein